MSDDLSVNLNPPISAGATIRGNVDGLWDFAIRGWAYDKARADHRLRIDIVDERGRLVAQGTADTFREDLFEAGFAEGKCSFWIALPASLADGAPHRLHAVVSDTGDVIPGEIEIHERATAVGEIEGLNGRFLNGWVSDPAAPEGTLMVELIEDGKVVARARTKPVEGERHPFSLAIPDERLDGRAHAFSVRVPGSGRSFADTAVIAPWATPLPEVMRRSAATALERPLDARAPHRYESLTRQLAALTELADPAVLGNRLATLVALHREVVRGFEDRSKGGALTPLVFPEVPTPKVSVVIPVHGQREVTYHCLASLLLAPNRATFEVIVVDDGSPADSRPSSEIASGVRYLRNETARGFVHACNLGASAARGEYVVLLNNDCELTAGWLDALLDAFEQDEKVGLVGAKLLYPDGRLQEAGCIVWSNGQPWNYGRDGNARDPRYNYVRDADYVSGACVMLPKHIWDSIRGFDETFAPAYYEDVDLAFRVRREGYRTLYTPFCEIFHFEGMSNGTDLASGLKRFQAINEPKFKERWTDVYQAHARLGREQPDIAKDRQAMRALVVDAETPQPDRDAGSYAVTQEIRLLQSLGFKVTFVADHAMHLGRYTEALQRMGVECLFAPFMNSPAEVLQKRGSEFDLVYVARYYVASNLVDAARRHAPQARIVLNNIDLHFLREIRAALSRKDPDALESSFRTRENELEVMRRVDLVLSYNEVEHAVILSHNADATRTALCPWVVEGPGFVADFGSRSDIAFLGGFQHPPNVEAVEHFVGTIMPQLRERLPGVRFLIYGSQATTRLAEHAAPDVVLVGYVPSVEEVYGRCRIFVAPLLSGAGLKGKVVGAFAHGVPSVISPVAAEGLRIRDGNEAFVASTTEAWVTSIATLYEDEARWRAMSDAARAHAEAEFSFEKGRQVMEQALRTAGLFVASKHSALRTASPSPMDINRSGNGSAARGPTAQRG